MKKLISELREFIEETYKNKRLGYTLYIFLDRRISEMESLMSGKLLKLADSGFVELTDGMACFLLRRKDISWIAFREEPFTQVDIYMRNGNKMTFNVSENQEVLENLIADF